MKRLLALPPVGTIIQIVEPAAGGPNDKKVEPGLADPAILKLAPVPSQTSSHDIFGNGTYVTKSGNVTLLNPI
jgi:hypothetical protein